MPKPNQTPEPRVATSIPKSINDRARRYQAQVLIRDGRKITMKEAIAELIKIGADAADSDTPQVQTPARSR